MKDVKRTLRREAPVPECRFLLALAFAFTLALAMIGKGHGQGASGTGTVQARIGTEIETVPFTSFANTTSAAADLSAQSGARFSQSLANLNIVFQTLPTVDVQTAATQRNDVSTTSTLVIASANAILRFKSRITFKSDPPFVSPTYPVIFRAPYAMTDFDTTNASASVRVVVFDPEGVEFFDQTRQLGVDPAEGTFIVRGPLEPLEFVEIWMEANAFSEASNLSARATPVFSEAQAVLGADRFITPPPRRPKAAPGDSIPTHFSFDQAAFDAIHGANSYTLTDFLKFELSPNLLPRPDLSNLDFTVVRLGDEVTVTFNPLAGFNHTVEVNGTLAPDGWSDLPGAPHNSGKVTEKVDAALPERYYRVRVVGQ